MSNVIHAIYEEGVFRPMEPVDLPERTHVEFEPRVVSDVPTSLSFWKSNSLQELAAQQGVSPALDLDEISALWPPEDDPDELLEHLGRERDARRSLTPENRPS